MSARAIRKGRDVAMRRFSLAAVVTALTIVVGGPFGTNGQPAKPTLSVEQIAAAIGFLRVPAKDPSKIDIGTGFLLTANERLFLVTAAHVARLMKFSVASLTSAARTMRRR